jgi:hypothetical protein
MECVGKVTIGMTQRCKRFLEAVYSAGAISEQAVYRSGTGAKGKGQLEKQLLSEALHLFLGDGCLPVDIALCWKRKLQHGTIAALEKKLTTKLDRTRLDKETRINWDDDAASHLFNGVHHIYNRINVAKSREVEVGGRSLPNNIKDVLDEVMEYEPSEIGPNMNDHLFDDDADDDEADDDDGDLLLRTDTNILPVKPCLMDLTRTGWDELAKVKVSEVRQHAKDRVVRKRDTMKYIMLQVI